MPQRRRVLAAIVCVSAIALPLSVLTSARDQAAANALLMFQEFAGSWTLDESASRGRIAGIPAAKTLIIAPTAETIRVGSNPISLLNYPVDGREVKLSGDRSIRFTFGAGKLILTSTRTRSIRLANVITDIYAVEGDVLTVERQVTVVSTPDEGAGHIVTPASGTLESLRQTNVYRRDSRGR
jgi:hypothetical protein